MFGKNPIRPQVLDSGLTLWVQKVFYTLQGEGPFSGQPAVFIRLAGCNLRCFWCDTDFESSSWAPTLDELMMQVQATAPEVCNLAVITGGEPFRQNIAPLVQRLLQKNMRVQIETNGTLWVDLPEDPRLFIVCSPKTSSLHPDILPRITAFKYVIDSGGCAEEDGLPNLSTQRQGKSTRLARPPAGGQPDVYVMPLDECNRQRNTANMQYCVDIAKRFGYKLTLQTHKLLDIE
jgi:organic radical activating enzyme